MTGAGGGTLQSNEITIKIKNNGTWKANWNKRKNKKKTEGSFLSELYPFCISFRVSCYSTLIKIQQL